MDAALFVKEQENCFDVIIVDSSDPVGKKSLNNREIIIVGPAESLYTNSFYNTMKSALRQGGIICTQVFSMCCSFLFMSRENVNGFIFP